MTGRRGRAARTALAVALGALAAGSACGPRGEQEAPADRDYLYLWTGSADSTQPDFLAVLDVTENGSERYGSLVTTIAVPDLHNGPHHTEHFLANDRQLFANGFASGRSYVFDLSTPDAPRIVRAFGDVDGYSHPHSFVRLPNGNVLATFQMKHENGKMLPGGLVEMTTEGVPVGSSSANAPGVDPTLRVYSALPVPSIDRIVTTSTDMEGDTPAARDLQVWRLSDRKLLKTFALPDGAVPGSGNLTAEARLMEDGKTVLVSTFNCGLFLLSGLDTDSPSGKLVADFPRIKDGYCAIPVISGHYYLVTVPSYRAVVSLDISDPSAPKEVSRVVLDSAAEPHWISISHDQRRVVLTGYGSMENTAYVLTFDPATGRLAMDDRFREEGATAPGFRMVDKQWPHGSSAKGKPHGAVFSIR